MTHDPHGWDSTGERAASDRPAPVAPSPEPSWAPPRPTAGSPTDQARATPHHPGAPQPYAGVPMHAPGPLAPVPAAWQGQPQQVRPVVVIPMKSAGVAVLLSFFLLGGGLLYAGKIGLGVAFLALDVLLWIMLGSLVLSFVAVPVWLIAFAITATVSAGAVKQHNARLLGA